MSKNQLFQVNQITDIVKFIARPTFDPSSFQKAKGMDVCVYEHKKVGLSYADVLIKRGTTDTDGKTTFDVSEIVKSNLSSGGFYYVKVLIEYESSGKTKKGTVYRSNKFFEFEYENEVKNIYFYLIPANDEAITKGYIQSAFEDSLYAINQIDTIKSANATAYIRPGKIHIDGDIEIKLLGKLEVDFEIELSEYSGHELDKFINIEFKDFDTKRKGLLWLSKLGLTDKFIANLLEEMFEKKTEKQINTSILNAVSENEFKQFIDFSSITIYRLRYPIVDHVKLDIPLPGGDKEIDIHAILPCVGIGFPRILQLK